MKQLIIAACVAASLTAFAGLALADKGHKPIAKTAISLEQAIDGAAYMLIAVPSHAFRETLRLLAPHADVRFTFYEDLPYKGVSLAEAAAETILNGVRAAS